MGRDDRLLGECLATVDEFLPRFLVKRVPVCPGIANLRCIDDERLY